MKCNAKIHDLRSKICRIPTCHLLKDIKETPIERLCLGYLQCFWNHLWIEITFALHLHRTHFLCLRWIFKTGWVKQTPVIDVNRTIVWKGEGRGIRGRDAHFQEIFTPTTITSLPLSKTTLFDFFLNYVLVFGFCLLQMHSVQWSVAKLLNFFTICNNLLWSWQTK